VGARLVEDDFPLVQKAHQELAGYSQKFRRLLRHHFLRRECDRLSLDKVVHNFQQEMIVSLGKGNFVQTPCCFALSEFPGFWVAVDIRYNCNQLEIFLVSLSPN
jgi:hypothetical protein